MSQILEFAGQVTRALPEDFSSDVMQGWITNRRGLERVLREALASTSPIITVTSAKLNLPSWVKEVEKDVSGPTGEMELEFIELLRSDETCLSGEEMQCRAASVGAELGLRHGRAFLNKYRTESFGSPDSTVVLLPGTVVVSDEAGRRLILCLVRRGHEWYEDWLWLEGGWLRSTRLMRPRV